MILIKLIKKFIPCFLLNWYHFLLALFGAVLYRFPSYPSKFSFGKLRRARKLKVIGITGTNGKSTTVELTAKILEEAGYKVASLSSIQFRIDKKEWKNLFKMTMPGRFEIQKFLRQALNAGCQYVVLEVTSEGIKQHRQRFINFEAAIFTNLAPEHIESHGSFEKYREAKGKFFQATKKIHIINADDKNAEYFWQFFAQRKHTYGLNKGDVNNKNLNLRLQLIGDFNIYNALAAICLGLSQGIDLGICKRAVEKVREIPGRMEEVISRPFKAIVDYAVTPDALEALYQTIREIFSPRKIIAVFGSCGGGRDKWRRPVLGEIAAKYCDEIILTNEDPYDENPVEIINQIAEGAEKISANQHLNQRKSVVYKILDRREAIRKSFELAGPGDMVLITGKGCEPWICLAKGKKMPWDDRQVAKEEFQKLKI